MANVTISDLPSLSTMTDSAVIPVDTGIATFQISGANLQNYFGANTGNIGFVGDAIYDLNGIILENADLSHNATAAVILPTNGDGNAIQINNTYGNIVIQSGDNANITGTWTFDNTGSFNLPTGGRLGSYGMGWTGLTTDGLTQGAVSVAVLSSNSGISGQSLSSIDLFSGNPDDTEGAVSISSGGPVNGYYQWQFKETGTIGFPTLITDLHNGGNQSAQTLKFGDPNQQVIITGPTPDVDVNAQRLIIQGQRGNGTGEGGDVYFWAGDADTNGGDIKIYAGDADNVSTGSGGYINLDGGSGFDGGGQISVTGGYSTGGVGGPVYISAGQGANGGVVNINGGGASANAGGYVNIQGGFGQSDGGAVTIAGGGSALGLPGYGNVQITSGVSTWIFDNTGKLTAPGTINALGTITSNGNTNGTAFAVVGNDAASNVALGFFPTGDTPAEMAIRDYSTANSSIYFDTTIGSANVGGLFQFRGSNAYTQYAVISQYGITLPTRPAFRVYGSGNTNISATTVLTGNNWTVDYQQGSALNSTTGIFTAPVAGLYQISMTIRSRSTTEPAMSSATCQNITGVTQNLTYVEFEANPSTGHVGSSTVAQLAQGDQLQLLVNAGNITFDNNDSWSVVFIG